MQSTPRQDLMPGLETGLLDSVRKPGVGALFPQPRIAKDSTTCQFDDEFISGFLVVLGSAFPERISPETLELCTKMKAQIVRFTDEASGETDNIPTVRETEGIVCRWLAKYDSAAAIVRPDHYVFALSSTNDELDRQLRELAAQLIEYQCDARNEIR